MTDRKLNAFLLLAPIIVLLIFGLLIKNRKKAPSRPPITTAQYPQIAATWQTCDFSSISSAESVSNLVQQLFIFKSSSLSGIQERELRLSLFYLIWSHHSGDYSDYRRFRTPVDARINPAKLEWIKKRLSHEPRSAKMADNELVELDHVMRNGSNGLRQFWLGLCKDQAEIVVEDLKTAPKPLSHIAMSRTNAGATCAQPTFLFEKDLQTIIKQAAVVKLATIHLLMQHSSPDPAFPYMVRLYWDEAAKRWLPLDMCFLWVNTAGLSRRTDF